MTRTNIKAVLVMGVSGSGKSTIAEGIAKELGWQYFDADDYHPQANIDKMASGNPLNDADRLPWLQTLHQLIKDNLRQGQSCTLACSALKESYRDILKQEGLAIVYLAGDFETIWQRMQERKGHYMKAEMLQSQFDALEEPMGTIGNIGDTALRISLKNTPEAIIEGAISDLKLKK